jgi:putative glutamine amidotransferase
MPRQKPRNWPANKAPVILVSSEVEDKGREFGDYSVSLSIRYEQALIRAGAIPWIVPSTVEPAIIAELVHRADGVMLTGGEDVSPELYGSSLGEPLHSTVRVTPDGGQRDLREILLVKEALKQGKPLLAICRGQQLLNVALGGTLIADIPTLCPGCINHRRMDLRTEVVHEARLTPDSLLAKITGKQQLGVNSTHHQSVGRVAPGLRVTASSEDGIVEGLELELESARKFPFLVSVQFHPERLEDRYPEHHAIFRAFAAACRRM